MFVFKSSSTNAGGIARKCEYERKKGGWFKFVKDMPARDPGVPIDKAFQSRAMGTFRCGNIEASGDCNEQMKTFFAILNCIV